MLQASPEGHDGDNAATRVAVTSVASTGTISLIAGTTAGIEPMFAIAFARDRQPAPAGGQPVL